MKKFKQILGNKKKDDEYQPAFLGFFKGDKKNQKDDEYQSVFLGFFKGKKNKDIKEE